jgi:flagellar biosynthesis/type III secretory pathway M-ring protein FliF/YscJ
VLILAVLFFFILRTISNLRNASKEAWKPVLRPVGEVAALIDDGLKSKPAPLQLQDDLSNALTRLAEKNEQLVAPKPENEDVIVQLRSRTQTATASEDEQRARIIARLTEENPATVAEIIQLWLSEGKKS